MNTQLKQATISLIIASIDEKSAIKIEESISKISNGNINIYLLYTVKILENLKNPYVIKCINDNIWNVENLVTFEKDTLNPEKWQHLQELRMPKNIKKEKKKGTSRCQRCKSWYVNYTTAQTRSADEPSTLFFYCTDCEYRWRIQFNSL